MNKLQSDTKPTRSVRPFVAHIRASGASSFHPPLPLHPTASNSATLGEYNNPESPSPPAASKHRNGKLHVSPLVVSHMGKTVVGAFDGADVTGPAVEGFAVVGAEDGFAVVGDAVVGDILGAWLGDNDDGAALGYTTSSSFKHLS